jgi:PAS domain S-box-containing protein
MEESTERQLAEALARIHDLEHELAETNRGLVAMAMDMERRVDERTEDLRENEERFRLSVENLLDAFAIYSAIRDEGGGIVDFRVEYANEAACTLTGRKAEDYVGKTVLELNPNLRETDFFGWYVRVVETGQSAVKESCRFDTVSHGRKETRYYDLRMARLGDGFTSSWRDVTERKAAEEELRRSRENLDRAEAVAQIGWWRLETATNVLTWSPENHRIFGVPEGTPMSYEFFLSTVHPDDRRYVDTQWAAGLQGKPYDIEHRIVADGQVKWVREKAYLEFGSQGELLGGFGITQDITARKEAEQALRASEEKYRSLFQNMTEGFALHEIITDEAGRPCDYRFIDLNPAFERMTGLRREELTGKRVKEVLPDTEEYWIECFGRVALTGEPLHMENYSNELGRWYEVLAYRTEARRFAVIFTDVTGRRRAQEDLKKLNETLERRVVERTAEVSRQADRLRALASELSNAEHRERKRLAGILHDHIQQLIVAARMQIEWMKRSDRPDRIQAMAQGADGILHEALEASRNLTIDLSPPALHEGGLIGGLNWLATRMREKNQFVVNLRADSKAEPASEEARFLLFECARELLFNAMKHAGVSEAEVLLTRTEHDQVRLCVSDRGAGFDAEDLRSRQAEEATFGLFSVQERLAYVAGHMEIETSPGRGTKVTLTAPVGKPAAALETAEAPAPSRDRAEAIDLHPMGDLLRVLIVDDHKIMREGLRGLLQFEPDIEVVGEAADGFHAVELAEKLSPDVVIMDVNLRGTNGVESTRRIMARRPGTKIIGLSMHVDDDVAMAMRDAGATAYLTKGGPSEDLIAAIRACRNR